ncbi:MAG: DUF1772 domain-containing protein [Rhizobacter sp.]|nr:DUF1772 domain-containing protein [Ferruginibacter sp.]
MENSISINIPPLVHVLAVLLTGLIAGLFYGYDCSVVTGLGKLNNETYLQAFQSINKVILRPYFFISFMGSLAVLPVAGWLSYTRGSSTAFYLLLFATIIYTVAVVGVTLFCNVPLNEQLSKFNVTAATQNEIAGMRALFEKPWNRYHTIRTVAAAFAFVLTILSLLKGKQLYEI